MTDMTPRQSTAHDSPEVIPPWLKVAVVLPCYNEEVAIGAVVTQFRNALPNAQIYVFNNASNDQTAARALAAGAIVYEEPMRGKGNVLRRAFAEIEADVYVVADGDGTYDAAEAPRLVSTLLAHRLDMVIGARQPESAASFPTGHGFGNALFTGVVRRLFSGRLTDIFSGYRALSRRFVKSIPALSTGFEIETELTVHALQLRLPMMEVPARYRKRPEGSVSKLHTLRDGIRIFGTIIAFLHQYRPFALYGSIGTFLVATALLLGLPVVEEFLKTGLVPRLPTALLATGLILLAAMSFVLGLLLHSVSRSAIEMKRLVYLGLPLLRTGSGAAEERSISTDRHRT